MKDKKMLKTGRKAHPHSKDKNELAVRKHSKFNNKTDDNETDDVETDDNETDDNETVDKETDENETDDKETDGNETGDNETAEEHDDLNELKSTVGEISAKEESKKNNKPKILHDRLPLDTSRVADPTDSFETLNLSPQTLRGLRSCGYFNMTPIQKKSLPISLAGKDILGEAATGSGKTLAFLIPALELLSKRVSQSGIGCIILAPTRELVTQIFQVADRIGAYHQLPAACVFGGFALKEQSKLISQMSLIVATPGRFLHHLQQTSGLFLDAVEMVIFDEADRLMDSGFHDAMKEIASYLPPVETRQNLMFSATITNAVRTLAKEFTQNAEVIRTCDAHTTDVPVTLDQFYLLTPLGDKLQNLHSCLREQKKQKVMIFVASCKQVRFIYEFFSKLKVGFKMLEMHGQQSQKKRMDVYNEFQTRTSAVCLICTDVASRGLDVSKVETVIQYDCPADVDTYVHRIGRTARCGKNGKSVLFLCLHEQRFLERLARQKSGQLLEMQLNKFKQIQISSKVKSFVEEDDALRHLSTRAIVTYVKALSLMKDAAIFDLREVLHAGVDLAKSYGLDEMPKLDFLNERQLSAAARLASFAGKENTSGITEGVAFEGSVKREKNKSKLQRFKEKIKQKLEENKMDGMVDVAAVDEAVNEIQLSSREKRKLKKEDLLQRSKSAVDSHLAKKRKLTK